MGGGGEGRMLISFQVRLLEKFTRHVNERGTSNLSSCIKVFREIMRSMSLEKTIMGHVYFRRQITPQAGS